VKCLTRALGVVAVPLLLIVSCSSGGDSAVSSTPTTSSSAKPSPTPTPTPSPTPTPAPAPKPPPPPPPTDPLTGGALVQGPVVAVKIDNTSAGLPQYGISGADMVYVEQVEGGLTRLMSVFHTNLPSEVGAVRSVRTTDAELLPVFGTPALVFSGGAGVPLDALAATPTIAISEDGGGPGFWRSDSASAPFNLHSNLQTVVGSVSGISQPNNIGLVFSAADPRVDAAPAATSLAVQYQAARLEFSAEGGGYRLLRNGDGESDAEGVPIVTDNVLFQDVSFEPDGEFDSVGSPSFISHTVGNGTFTLFRDGHAISGNWSRAAPDQPTQYLDAAGQPVPFKPGKTWVALVPPVASVSVS
jgi:hypothetical protein